MPEEAESTKGSAPTNDIIFQMSPNELEKEIKAIVDKDQRALPPRAKIFSAIAKLQKFDVLPEVGMPDEVNASIKGGSIELQRGISATKGIPSRFYAAELIRGAMYPGTLSAMGNGMYFSTVGKDAIASEHAAIPLVSRVAMMYTRGTEGAGILVRAALKKNAKIAYCEDLKADLRDNRNRAKKAGITDVGAFAAALGFDAFYADGLYSEVPDEVVYVVLNRGAVLMQRTCLMVP